MKAEYEEALEAARDVIYGESNIDPLDALANLLSAIEARGDEGAPPSDYIECRTIDGGVWYYPRMTDVAIDIACDALSQSGEWTRTLRLADECEESARAWANEIDTRQRAAAELRRLHVQAAQDEALLRQALEALEFVRSIESLGMVTDGTAKKAIAALRERLGDEKG